MTPTLIGLVVTGLVLMLILGATSVFYDIGKWIYFEAIRIIAVTKPLLPSRVAILKKYFFYYNRLPDKDRKRFEKRVNQFLHSKRFAGREDLVITEEMKVLISATSVMLTFGLPMIYLSHFYKIAVYPDAYYSRINKKYHFGEVNPMLGIIILSWKSFVEGFIDPNDSRNLGLHEMAHALHFENQIRNDEYDFLNPAILAKWDRLALIEIERINKNEDHFFRKYAGANQHEFFAVAMEYFFETPLEFKKALPELYTTLTHLVRQDPERLYQLS